MSKLKEALRTNRIKQRDLASAIGCTESAMSRMVNGEQGIDLSVAAAIVDALTKMTGRTWLVDELIRREEAAA